MQTICIQNPYICCNRCTHNDSVLEPCTISHCDVCLVDVTDFEVCDVCSPGYYDISSKTESVCSSEYLWNPKIKGNSYCGLITDECLWPSNNPKALH